MSLKSAKSSLQSAIETAYKNVKTNGEKDGAAPGDITKQLAIDLHTACDAFMSAADVTTEIDVPAGQVDTSSGATTFPGKGDGEGTISIPGGTIRIDIENAYNAAKTAGEKDGAKPGDIISTLADGLAKAIHKWSELAVVKTDCKIKHVHPTRMNNWAGVYMGPHGTGTGSGTIFFDMGTVDNLFSGIKTAFENVKINGEKDGADPGTIIEDLSWELADAIYYFAVEAEVDTDVVLPGGDVVAGSIVAGVVVPGSSMPWNGTGKGRHPANGLS